MICLKAGEERIALSHGDMNTLKRKEAEHIGARLRTIRRINMMDERRFSDLVHEESVFIRRFEDGVQTPPDKFMRKVCEKTGVRYEWLADGTGEMIEGARDVRDGKVGNVVQALARRMDEPEYIEDLEMGNWSANARSADECVREAEEELENFLEGQGILRDAEDLVSEVQSASEFRGYEHGMRYGARLVFQLLTGETSHGLEVLIQGALNRLSEIERMLQAGGRQ